MSAPVIKPLTSEEVDQLVAGLARKGKKGGAKIEAKTLSGAKPIVVSSTLPDDANPFAKYGYGTGAAFSGCKGGGGSFSGCKEGGSSSSSPLAPFSAGSKKRPFSAGKNLSELPDIEEDMSELDQEAISAFADVPPTPL